jgi:hypothetical protein
LTDAPDVLIVAAHEPDLRGLRSHLGDRLNRDIDGLLVVGKAVGVGTTAAASGTARRIQQLRPRSVVLIGGCALYDATGRPPLVVAERALLLDRSVLNGAAVYPEPLRTELTADPSLTAGLATGGGASRAGIATPLAWTVDEGLSLPIAARTGCAGESLELFGVAAAARAEDLPFAAVLGVTHTASRSGLAGAAGRAAAAAVACADFVAGWLAQGAPGLPRR